MAVKKAAARKAAPAKKVAATKKQTKKMKNGDSYECQLCGLVVSVDEVCDCVDVCDIICCGKPMKAV